MRNKILMLFLFIGFLIYPVLAEDYKPVGITSGGDQFIFLPSNTEVTYLETFDVPQNGILLLSMANNDTYIVTKSENSVQMVTVNKNNTDIIETILGWLGL